jgi:hypothetical protein
MRDDLLAQRSKTRSDLAHPLAHHLTVVGSHVCREEEEEEEVGEEGARPRCHLALEEEAAAAAGARRSPPLLLFRLRAAFLLRPRGCSRRRPLACSASAQLACSASTGRSTLRDRGLHHRPEPRRRSAEPQI